MFVSHHSHLLLGLALLLNAAGDARGQQAHAQDADRTRVLVHLTGAGPDLGPLRRLVRTRAVDPEAARRVVASLNAWVSLDRVALGRAVEALGGRVFASWWIVNGCGVEIRASQLEALRCLPRVARVESDGVVRVGHERSHSAYNHNVAPLHMNGLAGAGVTVAILDGEQDTDMGLGRPHRTYFIGGDPMNTSGPGIAGSRLLAVNQIGALSPGNIDCHGLAVAATVAGGDWGTSGGHPGVAYDATLQGYSVIDTLTGGWCGFTGSFSTITSAWQALLVDRATMPAMSVANASITGYHDPTVMMSQAMDAAAEVGDIFIATIAGNFAANTTESPGGTNTLITAAVRPDTHDVLEYSGRGPIWSSGPRPRSFPDLSAAIHQFSPDVNCETSDGVFNGTSAAAPQVAGVAAILRGAVPALSAVETKAILMASARDIDPANAGLPGALRDHIGVGLLRADLALTVAQDAQLHGSGSVTPAAPTVLVTVPAPAGAPCTAAVTWFRGSFSAADWENLDLRVFDGPVLLGASTSANNLDEVVSFVGPASGSIDLEVTGSGLLGVQSFAFAVADHSTPLPIAPVVEPFGRGCPGSASSAGTVCVGVNADATAADVAVHESMGNGELAMRLSFASPQTVNAAEFLLGCDEAAPVTVAVYADVGGVPVDPPLATATATFDNHVGWNRATFAAPLALPVGNVWFGVRFDGSRYRRHVLGPSPSEVAPVAIRTTCAGASWSVLGDARIGLRVLCGAGGTGRVPHLWTQGRPAAGTSVMLGLADALPATAAFCAFGISRELAAGNIPLPFDLGIIGAPDCLVFTSFDSVTLVLTDAQGRGSTSLFVPNDPATVDARLFAQYMVLDLAANALGLATSAAVSLR